jgi:hypothetical protein
VRIVPFGDVEVCVEKPGRVVGKVEGAEGRNSDALDSGERPRIVGIRKKTRVIKSTQRSIMSFRRYSSDWYMK